MVVLWGILKKLVLISGASLAVCLLFLEGLTRFVVPACESPFVYFDTAHGIQKYDNRLKREGVFTTGALAKQRAHWRINNHGWTSEIDYAPAAVRPEPLIAIIGDSYVEGFQTDIEHNLATVLRRLVRPEYQVYGFGMSGAPFSQYLHMNRYVRKVFTPDIIVFVLVDNDFDESIAEFKQQPYLMQLTMSDAGLTERPPVPYEPSGFKRMMSRSSAVRYLEVNLHFTQRIRQLFSWRNAGDRADSQQRVRGTLDRSVIEDATDLLVSTIRKENPDVDVVFMTDGFRRAIYAGEDTDEQLRWLHRMLREATHQHQCHFLDLNEAFSQHYSRTGEKLNSEYDYHWNDVGHRVAATALFEFLATNEIIHIRAVPGGEDMAVTRRGTHRPRGNED
jgi:hypothetical protein